MFWSSRASESNTALRRADQPAQVARAPAQLGHQQPVAVDQPLERHAPARGGARDAGQVAVDRLEPPEHLAQVLAAPAQALAGARHQQLEVRPRVRVERGVDLVRVDVRQRVGRPGCARRPSSTLPVPGVDLDEHVLERRLRPQQRGGVLADQVLVLVLDLDVDDREPVLELDARDAARPRCPPRAPSGPGRARPPGRSGARRGCAWAPPRRAGSGSPAG